MEFFWFGHVVFMGRIEAEGPRKKFNRKLPEITTDLLLVGKWLTAALSADSNAANAKRRASCHLCHENLPVQCSPLTGF
jgi:hypothetical protein